MTLNSTNAAEIETFVDLGLSLDSEPLISLVANPYQTYEFQKQYLTFTDAQFEDMSAAIERSLPKVRDQGFEDAETYLKQLLAILKQHRNTDNNPARLKYKNIARKAFRILPEQLQLPIRRTVQKVRTRRLEEYAADES